jgi:hypothetical protein
VWEGRTVTVTALSFLRASRARGLKDRASESSRHAWMVECLCCRSRACGRLTVRLTEPYDDGPARISCLNGCSREAILGALGLGERSASGSLLTPVTAELDGRRRTLVPYDVDGMLATPPPPVPWLHRPLLARESVTLLAGQPKTGKSMLGMQLAAGIGNGTPVLGLPCERGTALIIDGENGPRIVHERIHRLGIKPGTLGYHGTAGFSLRASLCEVEELVAARRPDLVVFDSYRSLTPDEEENDSGTVEAIIGPLRTLACRYPCAVLLLHHFAKTGGPRGSSAFGAAVDNAFDLLRDEKDPTRRRRVLINRACRIASEADPIWFDIRGGDDERVTLEAVDPPRQATSANSGPSQLEARFVRLLAQHGELQRAELCERAGVSADDGYVSRVLSQGVRSGRLLKPGRGRYAAPGTDRASLPPSAIGGEEGGMQPADDRGAAA